MKSSVITFPGSNCDRDMDVALKKFGFKNKMVWHDDVELPKSDLVVLPGGFSYGDYLRCGSMASKSKIMQSVINFANSGGMVMGICNGFQVLTKLGLLPDISKERDMALAPNIHGRFLDSWVQMERVKNAVCKWTKGLVHLEMPIRHGEGRVVFSRGRERQIYEELLKRGQIALRYKKDINGSYENIAGVTDRTGLILGLMPHPEGFLYRETHYQRRLTYEMMEEGDGLRLFKNIIEYCKKSGENV